MRDGRNSEVYFEHPCTNVFEEPPPPSPPRAKDTHNFAAVTELLTDK